MNKKAFLNMSLLFALILGLASCSNSKSSRLLKLIPEGYDVVAVVDVDNILKSMDGSIDDGKIQLPSWLSSQLPSNIKDEFKDFNAELAKSGVDIKSFAVAYSYRKNNGVFLINLDDSKKFVKTITNLDFDEEDQDGDFTLYSKGHWSHIVVNGDVAYALMDVSSDDNPLRMISRFAEDAKEASFASSKVGSFVADANAAGCAVRLPKEAAQSMSYMYGDAFARQMSQYLNGYICFKADINGDELTITGKAFDDEGNARDFKDFNMVNTDAKISKQALSYLTPNETFVCAVAIQDAKFDKILNQIAENTYSSSDKMAFNAVKSFLKQIDGTVAFGFGLTDGLESLYLMATEQPQMLTQFDATLVIQTKEGKTKAMMKDITELIDQTGMPYDKTSGGITIPVQDDFKINIMADGDFLVVSNRSAKKQGENDTADEADLEDYISGIALLLKKDNKLMRDFNLKYDIFASLVGDAKKGESILKIKIEGKDSKKVLANLAGVAIDLSKELPDFQKRVDKYYSDKWDSYYGWGTETDIVPEPDFYDYGMDSVAVVEDWDYVY